MRSWSWRALAVQGFYGDFRCDPATGRLAVEVPSQDVAVALLDAPGAPNLACHLIDFIVPMMDGDLEKATLSVGAVAGDPPELRNRCAALLEWPSATAQGRNCEYNVLGKNRMVRARPNYGN